MSFPAVSERHTSPSYPLCSRRPLTKREKRLENKKRKIVAFLEIAKINEEERLKRAVKMKSKADTNTTMIDNETSLAKRMKWDKEGPSSENKDDFISFSDDINRDNKLEVKQSSDILSEELSKLRSEVLERRRAKIQQPLFYLTEVGISAKMKRKENNQENHCVPIFLQDVQHLLLYSLIGDVVPYKPRWCQLVRRGKVSHVAVLLVDGMSAYSFYKYLRNFSYTTQLFENVVEVIPPAVYNSCVAEELLLVPSNMAVHNKNSKLEGVLGSTSQKKQMIHKSLQACFQMRKTSIVDNVRKVHDKFSRLYLLLSPVQMLIENFPMPVKGYLDEKYQNYVFTKDEYEVVKPNSPMFALDCEMCLTEIHALELTRISLVNENLEVLYDTLVKPRNRIINYLTKFSGVTEQMLCNVATRLEDVQKHLKEILPPDAILCGQSLNNDLHALQMIHPYVIDTSVIYNLTGDRRRKTCLRILALNFLNMQIQCRQDGHCSTEDSVATMKLVLHKLQHSIDYGNVLLGYNPDKWIKEINLLNTNNSEQIDNKSYHQPDCISDISHVVENRTGMVGNMLHYLKVNKKNVAVIGHSDILNLYTSGNNGAKDSQSVVRIKAQGNKEVGQSLKQSAINYNLALAYMDLSKLEQEPERIQSRCCKLDRRIGKTYRALAPNALFMIIFSGSLKTNENGSFHNGLCLISLKV